MTVVGGDPAVLHVYRRTLSTTQPSDATDGPILDELFGWGALPNRPIKLVAVAEVPWWQAFGEKDLAIVTLEIAGTARELTLKGYYDAPVFNWEIADIDYGKGSDETLRERLERLAG